MKKNILLLLLLFSGCIFFTKFPQIESKKFEGNELKTNGFYYYLKKVDESGYYYKEFIPFRNGVGLIFHYSFIKANNFDDFILNMSNSIMSIKGKFSQEHWCGFYINN